MLLRVNEAFFFFFIFLVMEEANVLNCLLHADASVDDAGSSFTWKFWGN